MRSFSVADCRKMRSPQTIGEELPVPGMVARHAIPSVSVHWTGTCLSLEMPSPFGPRKRGQFSACAANTAQVNVRIETDNRSPLHGVCILLRPCRSVRWDDQVRRLSYQPAGHGERGGGIDPAE